MSGYICQIWSFETKNFRVTVDAYHDDDVDTSFDETGEVQAKLDDGTYTAFRTEATVTHIPTGIELTQTHLGGSIYEDPMDFRDHVGINVKSRRDGRNYGSYFTQMVREAIEDARKESLRLQMALALITLKNKLHAA